MDQVVCKHITKIYGDKKKGEVEIVALKDANFEIKKGEVVVILGPSGAGKTTLLNILGAMDTATSGSYYLSYKMLLK